MSESRYLAPGKGGFLNVSFNFNIRAGPLKVIGFIIDLTSLSFIVGSGPASSQ